MFANNYEGRVEFAREVLECNMRNLVRLKIMEKLGIDQSNVNEVYEKKKKQGTTKTTTDKWGLDEN